MLQRGQGDGCMESISKSWQAVTHRLESAAVFFWLRDPSESRESKLKMF